MARGLPAVSLGAEIDPQLVGEAERLLAAGGAPRPPGVTEQPEGHVLWWNFTARSAQSAPDDGGPLWAATPAAGNDGFIGVDIKGVRKWRIVGSGRNAGLQPERELVGLKVLNPRSPASLGAEGSVLACRVGEDRLEVWDLKPAKKRCELATARAVGEPLRLVLSADGSRVAAVWVAAGAPRQIWIHDAKSGTALAKIPGPVPPAALGLDLSVDGRFAVTTSDGVAHLFDTSTGRLLAVLDDSPVRFGRRRLPRTAAGLSPPARTTPSNCGTCRHSPPRPIVRASLRATSMGRRPRNGPSRAPPRRSSLSPRRPTCSSPRRSRCWPQKRGASSGGTWSGSRRTTPCSGPRREHRRLHSRSSGHADPDHCKGRQKRVGPRPV